MRSTVERGGTALGRRFPIPVRPPQRRPGPPRGRPAGGDLAGPRQDELLHHLLGPGGQRHLLGRRRLPPVRPAVAVVLRPLPEHPPRPGRRGRGARASSSTPTSSASRRTTTRSAATASCSTTSTACPSSHWTTRHRREVADLVERIREELAGCGLAHAEVLLSYLKILLVRATRLEAGAAGGLRAALARAARRPSPETAGTARGQLPRPPRPGRLRPAGCT